MNKKILLMLPVFLLLTSWVFAQDTYSYSFNNDVKGYDVIPITNACPSLDPLDEQCVAVGTVYPNTLATDIKNGIHFIRFDKHGNLLASVFINHSNADERAVKIVSIDNTCNFIIVSLIRENVPFAQDAIKLTTVDMNGQIIAESKIVSNLNTIPYNHLYPMDAILINNVVYIVGSASKETLNVNPLITNGLNFSNPNQAFVCRVDLTNPVVNDIIYFGNSNVPFNLNGSKSYFNLARSIKQTYDGRVFIMGMVSCWQGFPIFTTPTNVYPVAMIAELDLGSFSISTKNKYDNIVGNNVGTIATDLYYDKYSDKMNLLVNEVKINSQSTLGVQNTTLLPWDAFWVYKLGKSTFNHLGGNKFQPFDNLYATNFVEQLNGGLKIVGWQFTTDVSHTSTFTINRDCPFIQNVTVDNTISNFMTPTTLNTLVEGTINATSPYQYLGGQNLSSNWQMPRIGSLSGVYDNLILTGTHLLNAPKFGLKCIYTDNFGSSCGLQEMHYSSSYIVTPNLAPSQIDDLPNDIYLPSLLNSDTLGLPYIFKASCTNDYLFRKTKSVVVENKILIYPNRIQSCEGFHISYSNKTSINSKITIKLFNTIGKQLYSNSCNFNGDIFVDPMQLIPGVYIVEVNIDDKIYNERIEVF